MTGAAAPIPPPRRRLVPSDPQQWAFALASLVNMVGSGLYIASSALYATQVLRLSVVQAGAALTVAAVLGQLAGLPSGHIADRFGARSTYAVTKLLGAGAMASLLIVDGLATFTGSCCAVAALSSASAAARQPIVRALGGSDPVRYRAYLRSVANLGITIGAAGAGIATQIDRPAAYLALIALNSASSLLCAVLVWARVRPVTVPPDPRSARRAVVAVRDRRFVLLTLVNGGMSIHSAMLSFALPLWVVEHTDAPRGVVGAMLVINTAMVVALQIRFSAGVDSSRAALHLMPKAGVAFLLMAMTVVTAQAVSGWAAAGVLLLSVVIYTVGELWHATAAYELMFRFAQPHAQGQYAGLFNFGQGLADAAGPLLLGATCLHWGTPGWLAVGAILALIGGTAPIALRPSARHRLVRPGRRSLSARFGSASSGSAFSVSASHRR